MQKVLITLLFIIVFFMNFLPVRDTDFGWHYRCGVDLLNGQPCLSNTYSYFLPQYKAAYSTFLFDGLTAVTYNSFGFTGLSILHAIVLLLLALLYFKYTHMSVVSVATLIIATFLSQSILNIGWRPQIVSVLFMFLTYLLLTKILKGHLKFLVILPVVTLVWVNTHMGFFTGLILVFFAIVDRFVRAVIYKDRSALKHSILLATTGIAMLVVSGLNPFGYQIYAEIRHHMTVQLNTMIAEWTAPAVLHIIIITTLLVVITFITVLKRKISIFETLTLVFFAILAITARRNLPLFYFISLAQLSNLIPLRRIKKWAELDFLIFPFVATLSIAIMVIRISSTRNYYDTITKTCTNALYPCQALKDYPEISGNVFAPYEGAGTIIWKRPDLKVFVDGRMPAWTDEKGESPYEVYLHIIQTQPGWNETLSKWNTDYLLIGKGTFLGLLLEQESQEFGWKKVYENESEVIYEDVREKKE
ncbi:hypothetical protein KBD81_02305 [Candidatus Woesebacteria bacterium]|nr:hypothetical protein [Candidatus Woesebacteria bacterium]